MSKNIFVVLIVLLILGGIYSALVRQSTPEEPPPIEPPPVTGETLTFEDPLQRFSVAYPADYFVWLPGISGGEMVEDYTVQFFEDTAENHTVVEGRAPGREGPMAITVNIYPKKLVQESITPYLLAWLGASPESNFQLGDRQVTPVRLGGREAFRYHWSGLYEGDSIAAILDERSVLVLTRTYITSEDSTYQDFDAVVSGFKWLTPPVILDALEIGQEIASPLTVTGRAIGPWFFEASFPVNLVDWDGRIIAETFAQAEGDPITGEVNWMTTGYVPFTTTITFTPPPGNIPRGAIIFKKDNPSGLPEHDDAIEVPIRFSGLVL